MPTEKASEFLDSHLKEIMEENWSCLKDSNDFINKMKNLKEFFKNALLITTDVVGLYPSIPHEAELEALKKVRKKTKNKSTSTNCHTRIVGFIFLNLNSLHARLNSHYKAWGYKKKKHKKIKAYWKSF